MKCENCGKEHECETESIKVGKNNYRFCCSANCANTLANRHTLGAAVRTLLADEEFIKRLGLETGYMVGMRKALRNAAGMKE